MYIKIEWIWSSFLKRTFFSFIFCGAGGLPWCALTPSNWSLWVLFVMRISGGGGGFFIRNKVDHIFDPLKNKFIGLILHVDLSFRHWDRVNFFFFFPCRLNWLWLWWNAMLVRRWSGTSDGSWERKEVFFFFKFTRLIFNGFFFWDVDGN